jgi:regulator of RNase E activity RraA
MPAPRRPLRAAVERLARHDTADLSDAMRHSRTAVGLRPFGRTGSRAAGPAVTASLPVGGVDTLKLAMQLCEEGDVLVIAARGAAHYAAWGGHINEAMARRGVAGVVVDGCIRDAAEIREGDIPVAARGEATAACSRDSAGEVNVPVACAGMVVCPGDIVVLDDNGVVAVPAEQVEVVLASAAEIASMHDSWASDVEAGMVPGIQDVISRSRNNGVDLATIVGAT